MHVETLLVQVALLRGTRHGFDEVRDAWVTWFEAFEDVDFEIEELIDQRLPSVWTVRGGRVVRVRGYREAADALDAAGCAGRAVRRRRLCDGERRRVLTGGVYRV
jgi:hypothetical protein